MSSLHKYWLREFAKFFGIIQMIVMVLFILIDYLSRLDKFLNAEMSLTSALGYVLLKVPFMFVQLTPASILLASIAVFALMNRNNELLAIRSSGVSIYYLVKPALLAGSVLAVLMFFLGETFIPVSMAKANYIKNHVIKKRQGYLSARQDIWIKSDNKLVHINYYDPLSKTVSGITITSMDSDFGIQSRVDAARGYYKAGEWKFVDIIEQIHKKDSGDYDVLLVDEKIVSLAFEPQDLGEISKKSNEMSFFELLKYVKKVEQEGYDARVYKVDLNGKIAFPFICIIMVLTGAATGMKAFVKNNMPVAIAIGVVIAFMYWIGYGFCLSLGYGEILPPLISAWTTNLFFLGFGVLYLVNTE